MRSSRIAIGWLALTLLFHPVSVRAQEEALEWMTDVRMARAAALAQNKPILLHFRGSFCRPCLNLEKFVFTNPLVAKAIVDNFVPVKVDVETDPELARLFNVTTIPHDVVVTVDGFVLAKQASSSNSDGYIRMVESIADKYSRSHPASIAAAAQLASEVIDRPQMAKAYLPAGQSSVEPEPLKQIGHRELSDGTDVRKVTGEPMAPVMSDQREFKSVAAADQFLTDLQLNLSGAKPGPVAVAGGLALSHPESPIAPTRHVLQPMNESAMAAGSNENSLAGEGQTAHPSPVNVKNPWTQSPAADETCDNQSACSETNCDSCEPGDCETCPPHETSSTTAAPAAASANPLADSTPLGFAGYCPVTWFAKGELVRGQESWGCIHRGKLYLFASADHREQFRASPDRLSPGLAGFDPVSYTHEGTLIEGSLDFQFVLETGGDKSIYLFRSPENRALFAQDPEHYVTQVRLALQAADAAR